VESIVSGKEPTISSVEAKKTMDLIYAIYKSAERGLPVKLS